MGGGAPGFGDDGGGPGWLWEYGGRWVEVPPGLGMMGVVLGGCGSMGEHGGRCPRVWGGAPGWLGDAFYSWGRHRRFHIVGAHGHIWGAEHYSQSNGGA